MRLRSVEENGDVTVITGSFFGELNLTVTNKEGEVINEFSGTALEMREMQKMTQEESGDTYNHEENEVKVGFSDAKEKEEYEKSINKIKLQPNTLYYLKEKIYDNSGDSVGPGLVTFDDRFAVGFIDQYGKAPVAIDSHYLEKDKIFKVKRRDIVKVVSNEKTNNGVVGKTGFLLRSGELVKGKSLIGPYVVLEEVEPVSDKKAQKFFEKEITKTRTRG